MDRLRSTLGLTPGTLYAPYLTGALVATALAALALPSALALGLPPYAAWPVGLILLAMAGCFVAFLVYAARQEAANVAGTLAGEVWARWRYGAVDRDRLAEQEWARTQTVVRQSLGAAAMAGSIAGGTFAVSGMGFAVSAAFGGAIAGLLLLIALAIYLRGRYRYANHHAREREVVFGRGALLRDGVYLPVWGERTRLHAVALVPAPPGGAAGDATPAFLRLVRLVERRTQPVAWWDIFTHRYWAETATELPVPAGQEAAAQTLVERYRHAYGLPTDRLTPSPAAEPATGLAARPS